MTAPVVIDVRRDGTIARLTLTGELDLAGADEVSDLGLVYLDMADIDEVIVDLAGLTFIDSSGIRALVICKNRSVEVGKALRVIGSHGPVAKVLELCGLTDYLAGDDLTAGNDGSSHAAEA